MASLSSSSTDAQVKAAYDDNAAFWESVAKCKAFMEACTILFRRLPAQGAAAGALAEFRLNDVKEMFIEAKRWLAANDTTSGAGIRHVDFTGFRE